jgi:IrrE N-terminal-like domain
MELLSELEQARAAHPGQSDAALIEQLAAELGTELELEPPIDVDLLASARGIGRIEVVDLPWSGCLLSDESGMRIQVRARDHPRRQRFTGCHEVSHTLLPGFTTTTAAYRCTPEDGQPAEPTDRDLEQLADIAASEFLLPRRHVTADLLDAPFGWDTIEAVAQEYEASLEATARRFIALTEAPVLLLTLKPNVSRSNPTPLLRVASRTQSGRWPFIPVNKSVPNGHPIAGAQIGLAVDEITDLSCLTGTEPLLVTLSARPYPYYDVQGSQTMRVLALATPVRSTATHGHHHG